MSCVLVRQIVQIVNDTTNSDPLNVIKTAISGVLSLTWCFHFKFKHAFLIVFKRECATKPTFLSFHLLFLKRMNYSDTDRQISWSYLSATQTRPVNKVSEASRFSSVNLQKC